jgi:ATP-binding cassette subfamily C protein
MSYLKEFFEKQGRPFEAKGNRPILLDNSSKVWMIATGQVDIFSVPVKAREIAGARDHIFRAQECEGFFGLDLDGDGEGMGLLAVGSPSTTIIELEISKLIELSKDQTYLEDLEVFFGGWIDGLLRGIGKEFVFPRRFLDLEAGSEASGGNGTIFRTPQRPIWFRHIEGKSWLMGRREWDQISGGQLFPLSKSAWIEADGNVKIASISMEEFFGQDPLLRALAQFHKYIIECIKVNRKQAEIADVEHLKKKEESDRSALASALSRLGLILERKRAKIIPKGTEDDAIFLCCQMIGEYLDIPVKATERSENGGRKNLTLDDIARTSGFRTRMVILRDDWWRNDHGPLLAQIQGGGQYVALIPRSARKYELYNPIEGTKKKLTKKMANEIAPRAYTFYRPLPLKKLTGMDLLKFGLKGCTGDIKLLIIMGILGSLLSLFTPVMTGVIFETIIPEAARGQLAQIAIILVTCATATAVFETVKGVALLRAEGKIDYSLQAAIWDRLLSLPVPFFREYSAGDLAKRAMGINQMRQILSGVTVSSILGCLFSSFNLALLFYYDWQLALIGVGLSFIGIAATVFASYLMVRYQRQISQIEGKISGMILQFISGISKLRVSGTEDRAFTEWAKNFAQKKQLAYKAGTIQNFLASFNASFPVIASMAIFTWVIWKSLKGGLTTGNFLAFNAAYAAFQTAMLQMASSLTNTLNIVPLYERAKPIIETIPEADESKAPPGELAGDIEVRDVYFRYKPDGPLILKGVSLHVKPGEFVAIVGGSGSGKSTLFRCLLGFETPESGTIYYDGQDFSSLDIREVRRQIGVVLQNAAVMPGDIFKNIVAASNLTIEDAWEAARMVGLDEDIKAMPMGMHTVIPPGGGTLSGGQRQRIIIARALVRRPRILYFDEATSALDNKTQAIVSRSLEKLFVTRIVIAHRLSTIINANRIYVLQDGEILEAGNYEELMAKRGFFYELAKRQLA